MPTELLVLWKNRWHRAFVKASLKASAGTSNSRLLFREVFEGYQTKPHHRNEADEVVCPVRQVKQADQQDGCKEKIQVFHTTNLCEFMTN